jgi:hypothetical protein
MSCEVIDSKDCVTISVCWYVCKSITPHSDQK